MDVALFRFELPAELIAQQPLPGRSSARLLVVEGAAAPFCDRQIADLPALLEPGDLLVFNDTRVVPARLHGRKPSGGAVELLFERLMNPHTALVQLKVSKKPLDRWAIVLDDGTTLTVEGREDGFFRVHAPCPWLSLLEALGEIPLPPYISRQADATDQERYQTVFAANPGAVAAPTAGLHFDQPLLDRLAARGVARATVTLHVGAGTFQPIRVDDLNQHRMHAEWYGVPAATVAAIAETRARGGRVIAVGTTAVRALESAAAQPGGLAPGSGETRIFIRPGHVFRSIDGLLTNFHLPESTLLVLVSALMGRERMLAAYAHAVARRYRFFSYGDACLLLPGASNNP